MKTLRLRPLGVEIGEAVIQGFGGVEISRLKSLLAAYGVAVFRRQTISDEDFVTFLRRLGTMTFTVGEKSVDHEPMLNIVSNVGRTTKPRSVFHIDTSYVSNPPAYTALRAVQLPESGGETLFTCQYAAYDSLPSDFKHGLQNLKVLHAATGVNLSNDDETEAWHPLVSRHPRSGRQALYLSTPQRCIRVSPIDKERGRRLIDFLYRHSIRARNIYRHVWQPQDVVIWDNRCTMHRADHSQVEGDRILHRGLVLDPPANESALRFRASTEPVSAHPS